MRDENEDMCIRTGGRGGGGGGEREDACDHGLSRRSLRAKPALQVDEHWKAKHEKR